MVLKDKAILRELAKRHMELAAADANKDRVKRIKNINSLRPDRPVVWIDEIPWHEMDIGNALTLQCTGEEAQHIERYFRRVQYRWKYIQADMVVEDTYYIHKHFTSTGIGVEISEDTISFDSNNHIISHHYKNQLSTEDEVEKLKTPVITADPDTDRQNLEYIGELLDGIMPVKLRGYNVGFTGWDTIIRLCGVNNMFVGLYDNPELMHKITAKFAESELSKMLQMQEQGLLDFNIASLHCTPPYVDGLPADDYDGGKVRLKDVWYRGTAQPFASVSPEMHEEFELQYAKKLMEKCGLVYYGCCEPLCNKIYLLKKIPNMRKIGVTPWADKQKNAEQIGGGYVYAYKPNPALVAGNFNPDAVCREIGDVLETCLLHKCPAEFVLKDISTVSYKPQNLVDWNNVVQKTIDKYY